MEDKKMMNVKKVLMAILIGLFSVSSANAVSTEIIVRVKSKDAKFIGSSMGGVLITIKDVDTGELLAKGVATGGTGNTQLLMKTPHSPGMILSDEKASKFKTSIDIDEPRLVEVSAYGPLAQRQSANRISTTQWVVPGKHITGGDAWMLELPGLVVDILEPPAAIKFGNVPEKVEVRANVTMMCGCPITPGGLWDTEKFEIMALLKKNGKPAKEFPLKYSGQASQFKTSLPVSEKGTYELIVYAYDPANGNTGLDRASFIIK
jgi:hypothetical protein